MTGPRLRHATIYKMDKILTVSSLPLSPSLGHHSPSQEEGRGMRNIEWTGQDQAQIEGAMGWTEKGEKDKGREGLVD